MPRFPSDANKRRVIKALQALGFETVREGNHVAMKRKNPDGSVTPLTMPGHSTLKASTLRTICSQSGISRADFLRAYENSQHRGCAELWMKDTKLRIFSRCRVNRPLMWSSSALTPAPYPRRRTPTPRRLPPDRAAPALRPAEFELEPHPDGSRRPLQRIPAHALVLWIQQPVKLRAAGPHAFGHTDLGEILCLHRL